MDFLTVITPEGSSVRRDIDATTCACGRASGNDLVLKDLNVSRTHAAIVRQADGVFVPMPGEERHVRQRPAHRRADPPRPG